MYSIKLWHPAIVICRPSDLSCVGSRVSVPEIFMRTLCSLISQTEYYLFRTVRLLLYCN